MRDARPPTFSREDASSRPASAEPLPTPECRVPTAERTELSTESPATVDARTAHPRRRQRPAPPAPAHASDRCLSRLVCRPSQHLAARPAAAHIPAQRHRTTPGAQRCIASPDLRPQAIATRPLPRLSRIRAVRIVDPGRPRCDERRGPA